MVMAICNDKNGMKRHSEAGAQMKIISCDITLNNMGTKTDSELHMYVGMIDLYLLCLHIRSSNFQYNFFYASLYRIGCLFIKSACIRDLWHISINGKKLNKDKSIKLYD